MMDLSDGLGADLPRLARASGVGFEVDESAIPRHRGCSVEQAITDGEDYELLFAISPRDEQRLQASWRKKFPKLPLTRIGRLTRQSVIAQSKFPRLCSFQIALKRRLRSGAERAEQLAPGMCSR